MGTRFTRWKRRALWAVGTGFVLGLVGLAVAAPLTYVAVHETAQPEFCISCHIMDPYYASWEASAHKDVSCVVCHYEPGAVETLGGKFQALSQLSKYITRTQGTKPWAEVSDTSCLRSGCHSVSTLDGPVAFGKAKFDHRPHLLDAREGKQLRCVTCHSQIIQSEHISVPESVCYACHFMPGPDGELDAELSDCLRCHDAPAGPVDVAGRPFEHAEYVRRGVDCRECHDPVVEGAGTVRQERCKSCHSDPAFIARRGETAFMHEEHVTRSKVECFECHDEIHHGLLTIEAHASGASEGCATCHGSQHDTVRLLYAGRGAAGTPDAPSRMHETRVLCEACHTGRSAGRSPDVGGAATGGAHGGVAVAGNIDCVHCHGPGFDGMLARWQTSVGEQLERLESGLGALEGRLPAATDHPARALLRAARDDLDLVTRDGSRGAHNVDYALDVLRSGATSLDRAHALLGVAEPNLAAGFPFRSRHGCSTCHMGVERSPVLTNEGRSFPHDAHLASIGFDCNACHSVEDHGRPAPARQDCNSCHHAESAERDVFDCAACHDAQEELLRGAFPHTSADAAVMGEMECAECHGEPPDILRPQPALCVLCHEPGFDRMQGQWQSVVGGELDRLGAALATVASRASDGPLRALVGEARAGLDLVTRDGSRGVHNVTGALDALRASAERIDRAGLALDPPLATDAVAGLPFLSADGCSVCHLGAESLEATTADGRTFPHGRHLEGAGLDCASCHSVEDHGQPAPERQSCVSCHHQERADLDVFECAGCHAGQQDFFLGTPAGFEPRAAAMPDKSCTECHGEPPDIVQPTGALCVLCHEEGYDEQLESWRTGTDRLVAEVTAALATAEARSAAPGAVERARAVLATVARDGSRGVHNAALAESLLREALRALTE